MSERIAWIIGINGQDGSYLTEILLEKGYYVYGTLRRVSAINTHRIDHIIHNERLKLFYGDLSDSANLLHTLQKIKDAHPRLRSEDGDIRLEIYNLGAQSHVMVSFEVPEYTADIDAVGTLRLLEAIRTSDLSDRVRFYQASTSELYGKVVETPQKETTPFYPRSPYGVAKLYGYWIVKNYREAYNIYACNGILFNHESPRRGPTFVTRKITIGLANILKGRQEHITLGNLDAKRDWGFARDYCLAMWMMLQRQKPDDFVIATGETRSVRSFIEEAFSVVGINISWKGEGVDEIGYDAVSGKVYIKVDKKYYRPTEVDLLLGDATKAKEELGWTPTVGFKELVKMMVEEEMRQTD